jgi:uncharacterized protein (DUF58 family)
MLYAPGPAIELERKMAEKLSNGDQNLVTIVCRNRYPFLITCKVIDEIPVQFQIRDFQLTYRFKKAGEQHHRYYLKPVTRGIYSFGRLLAYINSPLNLVTRRYIGLQPANVAVYPSYLQMHKYQLMAISNRLMETGIKPIRKVGHHTEFDQIRHYIKGDDYRTINWKATARKADLMVNQFIEEKSQPVYALIDMGRNMQTPFEGMTLLDYAINASLVLLNVALVKSDKAGLVTFNKKVESFLPASKRSMQMQNIMELLYAQQTNFEEPNYELLYTTIRRKLNQRSLLLLFTNFESPVSLNRQMKYLRGLAHHHKLVVVFFENTGLNQLIDSKIESIEDIYIQTIAEKAMHDKQLIAHELQLNGIQPVLTTPAQLTPETINTYIRIKSKEIL